MRVLGVLAMATALVIASGNARAEHAQLARLIGRLGSPQFAEREAAARELDALGATALTGLRQASASDDAEVRRRAETLVRTIEKRLETAQILTPQRIRLNYQDTPVTTAVADFAKKSGFPIQLEGDKTNLEIRKLTVDTGDTTFWDAFEQFCAKAGLVEPTAAETAVVEASKKQLIIQRQILLLRGTSFAVPGNGENRLVLKSGQPRSLPCWRAGTIRVRALPINAEHIRAEGEAMCNLEVTPEPNIQLLNLIGVRVNRAVDNHGLTLSQIPTPIADDAEFLGQVEVFIQGNTIDFDNDRGNQRVVPLRFKLPDKSARSIAQLDGTIEMQVRTPPLPLLRVDNVASATGQLVRGSDGSSVKVLALKEEGERVRVQLRLEVPSSGTMADLGNGLVRFNRKGRAEVSNDAVVSNLQLLDARGQALPLEDVVQADWTVREEGVAGECQLIYRLPKDQGRPSQLVFIGRRLAVIDVPFTLTQVPLR